MHTQFVSAFTRRPLTGIASLMIIAAMLTGWHTTGYAQANPESGQSLAGAWNVKIEFDTPGIEGCTAPGMNTNDGGIMPAGVPSQRVPDTVSGSEPETTQFGITFVGQGFDLATGAINSTYRVRASKTQQGPSAIQWTVRHRIFAPDGTLVFTASGIVTADRVHVEHCRDRLSLACGARYGRAPRGQHLERHRHRADTNHIAVREPGRRLDTSIGNESAVLAAQVFDGRFVPRDSDQAWRRDTLGESMNSSRSGSRPSTCSPSQSPRGRRPDQPEADLLSDRATLSYLAAGSRNA